MGPGALEPVICSRSQRDTHHHTLLGTTPMVHIVREEHAMRATPCMPNLLSYGFGGHMAFKACRISPIRRRWPVLTDLGPIHGCGLRMPSIFAPTLPSPPPLINSTERQCSVWCTCHTVLRLFRLMQSQRITLPMFIFLSLQARCSMHRGCADSRSHSTVPSRVVGNALALQCCDLLRPFFG